MAGAYLNQCMALSGEENSNKERQKPLHNQAQLTGLAKDANSTMNTVSDMSGFGGAVRKRLFSPQSDPGPYTGGDEDPESDSEPKTLISALASLEKTIKIQCNMLNAGQTPGHLRDVVTAAWSKARTTNTVDVGHHPPHVLPTRRNKQLVRGDKLSILMDDLTGTKNGTSDNVALMVTVYLRVVFLKIGEIDTMKENFAADAFVQAKWREPLFDGHLEISADDVDWEKYWNPKLYVENNIGEPKENIWYALKFNMKGEATVYERRRIKGCFLENLELDEFPFDTQDLTLTITSERSESDIELTEDLQELSSINIQSFIDEQEWKLHSHVDTWKSVTTRIYHNSKFKHPAISTSCRASRRPGFYIWNIFLVMLFICSLAFGTFIVNLQLPQNRLQLSFILLLTTITFKFVVSQTLPRISYLTYLDKYILTSMGILCAVCVWHSVVPLMANDLDKARLADNWAFGILGGTYIAFHVFFFLYIYFVALKKRWKYSEKDRQHKERIKKMQRLQEQEYTEVNSIRTEP